MMPVSVKHSWAPVAHGIPQKAFRDPKAAVGWVMDTLDSNLQIDCADLEQVNLSYGKAVMALQDGYALSFKVNGQSVYGIFRVEVH